MKFCCYKSVLFVLLLVISGCGSGKDKVGSLSLAVTSTALSGGQYSVGAVATYTNPNTTNLVGTEVTFDTSPSGLVSGFPKTYSMPTNGIQGVNMIIDQTASVQNFFVIARVGDLIDSKVVSIPALGTLVPSSTSVTFSNSEGVNTTKTVTVSGGSGTYGVTSSDDAVVTASVSGSTVTITRKSTATGSQTITITDTVSLKTATVTVTLS
jgi:hypothetical protein